MRSLHAIVSCCHTGPNPAPGLGIARSLRSAYPDAFLTGKDHSTQASGLHSDVFDEVWIARPWDEIHLADHREQIDERLEATDGYLLPGSDLETRWLAKTPQRRYLIPPLAVFERTAKPFEHVADILPVRVPEFISLDAGAREVYNFAVSHSWKVWAKGPVMDAYWVGSWRAIESARQRLTACWGRQNFFLQRHVAGQDVMVAFAAHEGRLLGTAYVDKRLVTAEGKCWAGQVAECPAGLESAVARLVRELNWTGGGELEFVRDANDHLWLIDWNYRFPAWIHGATIAGINLPGQLVQAAAKRTARPAHCESRQFTRIVLEVAVRDDFPLAAAPPAGRDGSVASKLSAASPSGLPQLMRRMFGPGANGSGKAAPRLRRAAVHVRGAFADAVREAAEAASVTPARVMLPTIAEETFRRVQELLSRPLPLPVRAAYSIKTNPDRRLMKLAKKYGFRAEAISAEELLWAQRLGFKLGEAIYNGPVPFDPNQVGGVKLGAVFADSLEALANLCRRGAATASTIGLRLGGFEAGSRFGVDLDDPAHFAKVAGTIRSRLPRDATFGLHFHLQSSAIGLEAWRRRARAMVELARSLQTAADRPVRLLDLGGGWTSESLATFLADDFAELLETIHERLPQVEEVVIEPGKAMCERSSVLVARVLEVRRSTKATELVADACLAEMPLAWDFSRDVYLLGQGGALRRLRSGPDRILGRICMEHDIMAAGLSIPAAIRPGDRLIFSHAGAYEATMSYTFGKGGFHE